MRMLEPIARIRTDFPSKFGIPRQSGIVDALKGTVVFEPKYRDATALRGLEGFSHLWLIWEFSESVMEEWSPTVKPPRLGELTDLFGLSQEFIAEKCQKWYGGGDHPHDARYDAAAAYLCMLVGEEMA